jgi:hypothetical protein
MDLFLHQLQLEQEEQEEVQVVQQVLKDPLQ